MKDDSKVVISYKVYFKGKDAVEFGGIFPNVETFRARSKIVNGIVQGIVFNDFVTKIEILQVRSIAP